MSLADPLSAPAALLGPSDPPPVELFNPEGAAPIMFVCDHAGRAIPAALGRLGLEETALARHIAWDIGIADLSRLLADRLDAWLALQTYSRLVIDCNRSPEVESSIVTLSEVTPIPGNRDLSAEDRARRIAEIFRPYHEAIAAELDRRRREDRPTVLIVMHSFTPVYKGVWRPWHVGVLYNRDPRYGRILLDLLRAEGDLIVGDNEPYSISDESDYTVPVHGERRGIPHVEIEIRQDLLGEEAGRRAWADRLARLLPMAYDRLLAGSPASERTPMESLQ